MTESRDTRAPDAAATLRALPAVDAVLRVLGDDGAAASAAVRAVLDELRAELKAGKGAPGANGAALPAVPDAAAIAGLAAARLAGARASGYPRVVNATGILLHTGLGRAPLAPGAAAALLESATGYAQLEVDPASGERRHRETALLADLRALTGGAAATVVNNNAAALLLALAALARGREVLVSRGELVEIGGGFRLPDVLALSGARMVEVGTTNRTWARDYEQALSAETALILRVHTSNFRVVGFQHAPERAELVALARARGVALLEDLGSGLLAPPGSWPGAGALGGVAGLSDEPDARTALAEGADLVCFSGDKLLGAPQAGLLVGREDLVARCRRHALFRAVRPDRLCLTALGATLRLLRDDPLATPVAAALAESPRARLQRAEALAAGLTAAFAASVPGARFEAVASQAQAGSGALPARPLTSAAVEVHWPGLDAEALARALRAGSPPVWAAAARGALHLDVLALLPGDDARLRQAFRGLPR